MNFEREQTAPLTKKRSSPKRIQASGTQVSSYHDEERRGRIGRRQGQVLAVIAESGPMTNRELAMALSTFPSNLTAALKNLEDAGKIVVVGERANPATRKRAMLYGLTT